MLTELDREHLVYFVGEMFGMAILDSGCSKTVTGQNWLSVYLNTLSLQDRKACKKLPSVNSFRFGDGRLVQSLGCVQIPVYIGQKRVTLSTDIVPCDIPLLISRHSMHRAGAVINFQTHSVTLFGQLVSVMISSSGHYCLPLTRRMEIDCKHTQSILFNFQMTDTGDALAKKVKKLHIQFAHPNPERLINLLRDAGIDDSSVFDLVKSITADCDTCKRYKKKPLRPVVGFPLASTFNEVLAVDLKSYGEGLYIFHIIDHLSRFSAACLIRNKKKGTIVQGFLSHWFKLFGAPGRILCDNGGEFINNEMNDLCEKLNIELKSTPAESAWSNGMVERHNGLLGSMMDKVVSDVNCSIEVALCWSIAAKNALSNVYGFSPNVLVFGRNPNLPNILINKPPANNPVSISKYLCENLNAMQVARESYIKQESSEKLKRALLRKSRGYSNQVFQIGDSVYFRREDNVYWHGPAKIIGHEGKMFLLKSNGLYVRVHACRLQHVSSSTHEDLSHENVHTSQPASSDHKGDCNECASSSDSDKDSDSTENRHDSAASNSSANVDSAETSDTSAAISNEHSDTDSDSILDNQQAQAVPRSCESSDNIINVRENKDLPKAGADIIFQLPSENEWRPATVINRGGKAKSGNWHYLNVKEGDSNKCISFKGSKWKLLESDGDDVLFIEEPNEDGAFNQAKDEELQKWSDMEVYCEVTDTGQPTISSRWVLTKKIKGGNVIHKARLVARGYEENTSLLKTDSPTCSKDCLRLVFALLSANEWTLHSIDIKSAFLQGLPLEREIYLKPPKHANTSNVWRLLKCPYGLADASRQWYLRVKDVVENLGAKQSKYDKSLFMWKSQGNLGGIIAVHVDDFIYGGLPEFHDLVITKIYDIFRVGSEEHRSFKYIGMEIKQNLANIQLCMPSYAASLTEFDMKLFDSDKNSKLTVEETRLLKKFSGQINWLATQCRPDIAYQNCIVANSLQSPSVKDLIYANKLVRRIKGTEGNLFFHAGLDLSECSVVSFCDASFGALPNGGSQGAFITFLVDKNGVYCPIAWQSRRIRRVVKSTLAAECLAAIESAESSVLLCTILNELLCSKMNSCKINVIVFCDNRNLVDSVYSSTIIEDKRLLIDVCVLRDMVSNGEIKDFRWLSADLQMANCLTKQGAPTNNLVRVMNEKLLLDVNTGEFKSG